MMYLLLFMRDCFLKIFLCLCFSFAQHAVSSQHVVHFVSALSLHSSLFCVRQTSSLSLCLWDIFHWATSWDAYQDMFGDLLWHISVDFGLLSHDSFAAVMVDKDKLQDTSVSMDTLGLDPDLTGTIQGSTSRVDSTSSTTSSSDESSSDGETGGVCSSQHPSKASDPEGLTDAQIKALVALGVLKSPSAGDGGLDMSQYYEDILANEGEAVQVAVAEVLAEAASDAVEGSIRPSTSSGPKQKQGLSGQGKQQGTTQGQSCG